MYVLGELWGDKVNLHYGNIDPRTRHIQPDTQLGKMRAPLIQNENKMRTMLNEEQKEQFEKCRDAAKELSDLMEREAFANGFCLAVKIMAEVMGTMEIPDIDE